jgi:hypothetical protein
MTPGTERWLEQLRLDGEDPKGHPRRSRRDLVASVFFTHHEPRVRDNEQRTAQTRPILGHPLPRPERSAGLEQLG